jgi:RNA ligase
MFDQEVLRDYEARGLIKSSTRGEFTVWCYTPEAVLSHSWDEVTRACRGLVYHESGKLVSRPYPKFFNWNQAEAVMETGPFEAYEKMDGTLIVVGNHNDQPVVNTKGSFTTWHTEKAESLLLGYCPPPGVTVLFELITPENRVVLDYNGFEGLVLLGGVFNDTGEDTERPAELAENTGWPGEVVRPHQFNMKSMLQTIQNPEAGEGHEGFVVVWTKRGAPSNRVKLKFDKYLRMHAVYSNMTTKAVWEAVQAGTLDDFMMLAPDEFEKAIIDVADDILDRADALMDEAKKHLKRAQAHKPGGTRADLAAFIMTPGNGVPRHLTPLVWMAYDEQWDRLRQAVVRMERPETKPLELPRTTTE